MKQLLIVLIVMFGIFLAIGCAGNDQGEEGEVEITPAEAGTPEPEVVAVTETVEETPVQEVTPAEGTVSTVVISGNNTTAGRTTIETNNTTRTSTTIAGENGSVTRVRTNTTDDEGY